MLEVKEHNFKKLIIITAQFCIDDEGLLNEVIALLCEKIYPVLVKNLRSLKDSEIRKQLTAFSHTVSLSTRTSIAKQSTSGNDDKRAFAPAESMCLRQLHMKKQIDDLGKSYQDGIE